MAVYDKEKEKTDKDADQLLRITGTGPEEERRLESRAHSGAANDISQRVSTPAKLNEYENKGAGDGATSAASASEASLSDQVGSGYREGDPGGLLSRVKGRLRGSITKRRAIIGIVITVATGGTLGLSSILQGPFQFIHKAQFLQRAHFGRQDSFSDDRSGKFAAYMLLGKTAKGRLGFLSNYVANKWEVRLNERAGLRSVYSPTTQRLIGYEILDESKAREFLSEVDSDGIPRANNLEGVDIEGKPITAAKVVDLRDEKFRRRRSVTKLATRGTGTSLVASKNGARLLTRRAGVNFHTMNFARHRGDDYLERRRKIQEENARQHETGSPNGPESGFKSRRAKALEKIRSLANSAKGPVAVATVVCTIKSFSDGIDAQNYENVQIARRMGMTAVTVGNQIMSNQDFDLETLRILNEDLYDEETGTSWSEDPGYQWETGREPTNHDFTADFKPGSKVKPQIFRAADSIPTTFFRINVCSALESASNLPGIKQALEAMSSATDAALGAVGIPTTDELTQKAQDYFADGGVDVLSAGAERMGYENKGVRLAANDQFIANGGRELSESEGIAAKNFTQAESQAEFARANLFERYFNISEGRSLAAQVVDKTPRSVGQLAATLMRLPSTLGSLGSNLLGGRVRAAATYDYGFPLYGYSLEEQDNPAYENPIANAAYIEEGDRLQRFNAEYGNQCFGITISATGDLVYDKAPDFTKIPLKCKDTANAELARYRFYIADMVTIHGLACYEGEEESCRQIGYGEAVSAGSPGKSNNEYIVGDIGESSDTIACAAGTNEIGIVQSRYNGEAKKTNGPLMIRLCQVPVIDGSGENTEGTKISGGAVVNSRVSGAWQALGKTAMDQGVPLRANSSFRLGDSCNGTGDGGACARPGTSYHQLGIAIDIADIEGIDTGRQSCDVRMRDPDSPSWNWLYNNAERYGIKQYSAEAWHWDAANMTNRCGRT